MSSKIQSNLPINPKRKQKWILTFLGWESWEMAVETDDVIDNDG